jgi:hypothetical protein
MSKILRSKQGCWTCRLRKKKCDEGQPQCSTCESLSITCYGYGPKPLWMDDGERQRAVIEEFKQKIRSTTRQKQQQQPAGQRIEHQHQRPVTIAMRPATTDSTASESNIVISSSRVASSSQPRNDASVSNPPNLLSSSQQDAASSEDWWPVRMILPHSLGCSSFSIAHPYSRTLRAIYGKIPLSPSLHETRCFSCISLTVSFPHNIHFTTQMRLMVDADGCYLCFVAQSHSTMVRWR